MTTIQPIRGTHDLLGESALKRGHIIAEFGIIAAAYGFTPIETPIIEDSNVFKRTVGDSSDIVSKEMFSFMDRNNEREICLRPEGTAGVMRAVLSNNLVQNIPLKYFYQGPMFRYERPQKGRQRQFTQLGIEYIGESSFLADVACISLAYQLLIDRLKIKDVVLELNTLGDLSDRHLHREKLKEYLEKYKSDLSEDSQRRLATNPLRILDSKNLKDQEITQDAPNLGDFLSNESRIFFERVCQGLDKIKVPYILNPRLVRGLDYYSHTTFEFKSNSLGAQDTILAGGRYNGLSEMLGGPHLPSVGWAAGLERLSFLYTPSSFLLKKHKIFILPMGESELLESFKVMSDIKQQCQNTAQHMEIIFKPTLKAALKQANKEEANLVMIIGADEIKNQEVTVKDLETGIQNRVAYSDLNQYIENHSNAYFTKILEQKS